MFFESIALNTFIIIILIFALTFDYITKFFSYWYIRHIPYKTPVPGFGSDVERVLGFRNTADVTKKLYNKYRKDKYVGYIKSRIPDLIVRDPDTIKLILCDDFNNFHDRGLCLDKSNDLYFKNNVFYAESEAWDALRMRIRTYFENESSWNKITDKSHQELRQMIPNHSSEVNIRDFVSDLMFRVLHNYVFVEKSLSGGHKNILKDVANQFQQLTIFARIKNYTMTIFPSLYVFFGMKTVAYDLAERVKKINRQSVDHNSDGTFLHFLHKQKEAGPIEIQSKNKNRKSKVITNPFDDNVIAGQILSFIGEGYVPCYNAVAMTLYELSKNQEIQDQVKKEADQVNIDTMNQATVLNNVIKEVLRLYPIYNVLNRKCMAIYKIPNTDIVIDKGVTITIPVGAIHMDELHYANPERFDPNRFTEEEVQKRHPFAYLPFGAGPRGCLGQQLAQHLIKTCVWAVLRGHSVERCARTPDNVHLEDTSFSTVLDQNVWIKLTPRQTR